MPDTPALSPAHAALVAETEDALLKTGVDLLTRAMEMGLVEIQGFLKKRIELNLAPIVAALAEADGRWKSADELDPLKVWIRRAMMTSRDGEPVDFVDAEVFANDAIAARLNGVIEVVILKRTDFDNWQAKARGEAGYLLAQVQALKTELARVTAERDALRGPLPMSGQVLGPTP